MTYDELFLEMSGCFLCKQLPINYFSLHDETLHEWMRDNAYAPYENWHPDELLSQIESVTDVAWNNRELYHGWKKELEEND